MPINLNSSLFTTPRRSFDMGPQLLPQRLGPQGPIDTFTPTLAPSSLQQQPQIGNISTSSSGGGGFFSNLWKSIKGAASALLTRGTDWLSQNAGGFMSTAKSWVSNLMDSLFSKASSWLGGLISGAQNWLNS